MNDPYVYEGTEVLINKAGIRDQKKLDDYESTMVQLALIDIFRKNENFSTIDTIFEIHARLFSEVYEWAGKKRTVNIVKYEQVLDGMSVQYSDCSKIDPDLSKIENKLAEIDWSTMSIDNKITMMAEMTADVWRVHAFREGNTRTVSVFLHSLMREAGLKLNSGFISTNAKYFRNALVMASLGEYRENQYLENILKGAVSDIKTPDSNSDRYRTINGYDVTRYKYNYHKTE